MTEDEIVEQIIELLERHKKGFAGVFSQEPYRGDYFRVFAAAFNNGLLTAGVGSGAGLTSGYLSSIIGTRAPELVGDKTWHDLWAAWGEWAYAWGRYPEFRSAPACDHDLVALAGGKLCCKICGAEVEE